MIINHKKVLRLTNKYNLLSVIRRRKPYYYSRNGELKYENILNRDFKADKPNEKWVTDISYIITPEGTLYLSAIRDLYDNYLVSYKVAKRQDYPLVERTIRTAIESEKPTGTLILHSDGGCQYRSYNYNGQTKKSGITPSMSRPGMPCDNALAENFFSIFKTECIYMEKPRTIEEAETITMDFMDYYNYERIQLRTGLTPYEVRCQGFANCAV